MIAKLVQDDPCEIHLRHLGAHMYESRTKDRAGALRMRALTAPGVHRDVVPERLVAEAGVLSESEHQRAERVAAELNRKGGKGDGKGDGKGKEGTDA